jgi:hypothetical protein
MHNAVYRRHKTVENKTIGFWLDTDNANVLIEEMFAHNNLVHGVAIEASQGPITVKDSIICHNQSDGLIVYNFRDITLENTIIYGNAGPQIEPAGWGRQVTNWETKEEIMLRAERLTVKGNIIAGKAANQFLLKASIADTENSDAWITFVNSLSSDSNTWHNAATPQVFQLPGGRTVDFRSWQSTTGQDSNSRFADPRFTDPDKHNFSSLSGSLW